MSDQEQKTTDAESANDKEPVAEKEPIVENDAATSVKIGAGGMLLMILLCMTWYLAADRFTPYTQQARIQGFVVGVAPKVAGVVTRVLVRNNQEVAGGQPLFEIDRSQ